jgi:tryptophan synthase alpha chain
MVVAIMSRLSEKFKTLRTQGERALIPYLTAGYPHPRHTVKIMQHLERGGADVIELGVPFSDPLADGPTIQKSSAVALGHGVTLSSVLDMVREFRATGSETPVVIFGAYNPYFHYGMEKFAADARAAGADAVLIADLPADDADEVAPVLKAEGLDLICLIAPTSNLERKRMICSHGSGFLYYISVKGVTGARETQQFELEQAIAEIKECSDLPVAVGFGISTPEQAAKVGGWADGVIVGSALINVITKAAEGSENAMYPAVEDYMRSLKEALP